MVINISNEQIDLPLVNSNETADIMILIEETKKGNDSAAEQLYLKFRNLLNGRYIQKLLKFNIYNDDSKEEIQSILDLIFFEAVHSYNPERAKFSTHLILSIKNRFREYYAKERLIKLNKTIVATGKLVEKIESTRILPLLEAQNERYREHKTINIKFGDSNIGIPQDIFLSMLRDKDISSLVPSKYRQIYREYIKNFSKEKPLDIKTLSSSLGITQFQFNYAIRKCNEIVKKKTIREIKEKA